MKSYRNQHKRLSNSLPILAAVSAVLSTANVSAQINPAKSYGVFPFQFEANRGQADLEYGFLARGSGYGLLLKPTEALLSLKGSDAEIHHATMLRMELVGADPKAALSGDEPLPGKINYLRGRDAKQWHTGISTYSKVKASRVYPGIDLVYYGNPKQLEYDFIVQPGADPKQIRWRFETLGQKAAALPYVDGQGELIVPGAAGDLRLHKPVIYQETEGRRQPVEGRFVAKAVDSGRAALVSFEVGRYDPAQTLVIDPVLGYSTYLGGERNEEGNAIAVDGSGSAYIGGEAEFGFPVTVGAYDTTYNGDKDAFIAKLDPNGSQLVYATYLGVVGTGNIFNSADDVVNAIAVDSAGQVYAAGKAGAGGTGPFPTTPGVFEPDCDGGNNFIVKLNATGSDLVYSTCVNTVNVRSIAVDGAGYAYVGGSGGSCGFFIHCPLTTGAYDTTFNGGGNDAFVGKLNPTGTAFVFGTLIGGAREDIGRGVAVDGLGNVYVTGSTKSTDFPTTAGALDTDANDADLNRDNDAFVAKLDPTGASLVYSTYLGGLDEDSGESIAVDAGNNAYVTGGTTSANFPTTVGAADTTYNGAGDAFIAKMNPTGSGLVYSTYLGGNLDDSGNGIAVDGGNNAYVVGDTRSLNFPLVEAPDTTSDTFEAFVTKLNAAGTGLIYSTYLGGGSVERGRAIALDVAGNAYVTGYTAVADFPTTVGALDTVQNGFDAFVVKLVDMAAPPPPQPPQPPQPQPPTISADLSLKVSAKRSIKAGRVLTYRLKASNKTKRVSAPSVSVTGRLPAGVSVIGLPSSCRQSGTNLTCDLGEIKARKTKGFSIKIRPTSAGLVTFQASVTGFVNDGNAANNSVTLTTQVR